MMAVFFFLLKPLSCLQSLHSEGYSQDIKMILNFMSIEHPQTGAHILVAPNMVLRATNEKLKLDLSFIRKNIVALHKSNIMIKADTLFLEEARKVAAKVSCTAVQILIVWKSQCSLAVPRPSAKVYYPLSTLTSSTQRCILTQLV